MKKAVAFILAAVMLLGLAACGGPTIPEEYLGKYICMAGEAFGLTLTGDDLAGWDISLEQGGKGKMNVEGETGSITYTIENGTITMKVDGEKLIGSIGDNMIRIENIFDSGMDVTFGKEGTEAANPENYLAEEEKAMLGSWVSYSVVDVMGYDASEKTDPEGLRLEIRGDHTVTVTKDGEEITSETWVSFGGDVYLDADMFWTINDGELVVEYYVGNDYFTFYCKK